MNLPFRVDYSSKLNNIRCLKADRDIKLGEIIEKCPAIPFSESTCELMNQTVMEHYYFEWGEGGAIVLGYGSVMNHSEDPNIEFERDPNSKYMVFTAIKDIKKDEELFVNYNQGVEEPVEEGYLNFDDKINSIL